MSASELTVERLLRAHAPHAPETLRARVLALEPAPRRINLPSRRLALVALPAALGFAVLAAVVHGLVGSGSQPVANVGAAQSLTRATPGVAVGSAPRALLPSHTRSADSAKADAAPSVTSPSRLQHTDASLQVRVSDVDALSEATTRATR